MSSNATTARAVPHARGYWYQVVKRTLDVLTSMVFLVLLLPLWLLIAVLIKLDSRGPVLFKNTAVGKDEEPFTMYKFRSMRVASNSDEHRQDVRRNFAEGQPTTIDEKGRPIFKSALVDASRITRVGKFLRQTSLDEAPQFWNVLRGEMSVVGPRPALPYEADLYDDMQRCRFHVKPGLTGLYQVSGRNRVPISEMLRLDLEYVEKQSVSLDLAIIVKTPLAMFLGI